MTRPNASSITDAAKRILAAQETAAQVARDAAAAAKPAPAPPPQPPR